MTPYGLHLLLPFKGHILDCIQLWLFQRWCKKEKQEQNTSLLPPDKPDGAHWSEGAKQSGLAKGCLIDLASEWFFLKWVSDQDCFACGAHKMQGATQSRVGVWKSVKGLSLEYFWKGWRSTNSWLWWLNPHPSTIPGSCLKTKFWIGPTACGSTQSCLHQDLNKPHDANFCNPPCIYVHYLVLQFYNFKVCHCWRQCIWHPSVILLAESQPGLSDTANLTFTTCLVLQTTTCTFFCLSARINPILSLMYFPYVIQSTCQRSEPACSCSSFRTGWTWVGVGSTW